MHGLPSLQLVAVPSPQHPFVQVSPDVQNAPSSQAAPFATTPYEQKSPPSSQVLLVQPLPSSQVAVPPVQAPAPLQVSPFVQKCPSLQDVPPGAFAYSHASVDSLQESRLQAFVSAQFFGLPPPQTPPLHFVPVVQNCASSQSLAFIGTGSWTQASIPSLHVSAVHALPSEQARGAPPRQTPDWHVSPTMQK